MRLTKMYKYAFLGTALCLASACGSLSQDGGGSRNTSAPTSSSSTNGSGAPTSTTAQPGSDGSSPTQSGAQGSCGNANTSIAPNSLNPNAFQYVYHQEGSGAIIFTTDPNACDTGSLVLHAGQPTISTSPSQNLGNVSNPGTGFALNTTSPGSSGECYLYGGDPNNTAQLSGGITHEDSGLNFFVAEYTLKIGERSADIVQNANFPGPNVIVKQCLFTSTFPGSTSERDPNVLVPCTP